MPQTLNPFRDLPVCEGKRQTTGMRLQRGLGEKLGRGHGLPGEKQIGRARSKKIL